MESRGQAQVAARLRRFLTVTGCVALVGVTACAAQVDKKAPEEKAAVQEVKTERARHQWRGPTQRLIDAVRTHGNLTTDQRTQVDTIARELKEDREKGHEALHEKLKASAVTVVRSGSASSAEFDESVGEAVKAIEERIQKNSDALEEIHGLLEADQRSAVAVELRRQIAERFGRAEDDQNKNKRRKDGFQRFASHLMLSKLQIDQLATIKKELLGEKRELRPTREELLEIVDAFESEDFRTPLNAFREKKMAIVHARVADAGKRADSVLSVFTPPQRELLADLILDGPAKVLGLEENVQTRAASN